MRFSMRPRSVAYVLSAILLASLVARATPVSAIEQGWQHYRTGLAPLAGAKQWILRGTKQTNGACRYSYPSKPTEIPESGWVVRTVAIDVAGCRKLFEEGAPSAFLSDASATTETASVGGSSPSDGLIAAASTRSAWQRVIWRDLGGVLVNAVMVQVNWTYNGSSVSGGSTNGAWQLNTASKWQLTAKGLTQLYGSGSSYYRGQGTATFYNDYFCNPLPPVRTYYYYVRVWGHPNGTSTRSQSSDSVDECLALHVDIESAYGQWPG